MVNKRYVARRLALMVVSLFTVVTILFFLFRMVPGGPMSAIMSPRMSPEAQRRVIEEFGLNEPLWKQYLLYMAQVVQLDFGQSFYYSRPVTSIIGDRFINTMALMLTAFTISYAFGIYFGAQLGWIRGTTKERAGMLVVLLLRSTPVFWTGMIVLYIFSFELGMFPLGGMRGVTANYSGTADKFLSVDFLYHLALPVFTLCTYYTGLPLLLMRNNLLEVLSEDYIDTARAKGLTNRRILFQHAVRNAILPVVTAFAIAVGFAVGGQVLIETVFSWPGLGREMVQAALRSDYPVAQGAFALMSFIVITMNFIADIAYTYLDPRVELGGT
ncbi:peptide/nickel transport system permease protein [Haladaptatus litoreus]|uniref:Peptide/nickel transport system permease protein n=1 Tax=Haladaptatus litoreus TaxID=553468 RepID=A0A1N7EI73_9EURY|nr:ABC transporter permease [Haladaptatus litoreus]SIR87760.1 peptide/nickel transport system permease protein [Haladaptatus litoreus]